MPAPQRGRFATTLQGHWWRQRPSALAQCLRPISWIYRSLLWLLRLPYANGWRAAHSVPVPVIVVGNIIVGGAGKTPAVMAMVRALQAQGWRPGVVSRGHGGTCTSWLEVLPDTSPVICGDEPLLMRLATGVPVWIGRQRAQAAALLCAAHPQVNVIVSDDGLQHLDLARDIEILIFDERGVGNGLCLPAGPLREPLPATLNVNTHLVYNTAAPSTVLPGQLSTRALTSASLLHDWWGGRQKHGLPLSVLRQQSLLAAAGTAAPERFFLMLEAAGLTIERLPLPDHFAYDTLPWPAHATDVIVTEKDAVKMARWSAADDHSNDDPGTRIWVVGLDFQLPEPTVHAVLQRLEALRPP